MNSLERRSGNPVYKTVIYIVLIFLAILSLFPFFVMRRSRIMRFH